MSKIEEMVQEGLKKLPNAKTLFLHPIHKPIEIKGLNILFMPQIPEDKFWLMEKSIDEIVAP